MPLRDLDVVLGKFLAALGLIAVALAMTIPYPISVDMVGALDWGPVIGGYIGLLLLAGAFLFFCENCLAFRIALRIGTPM